MLHKEDLNLCIAWRLTVAMNRFLLLELNVGFIFYQENQINL